MRFILYIILAVFVALQANGQGETNSTASPENSQTTDQAVYPLGAEAAAETEALNIVIEPDVYATLDGGPTDFLLYLNEHMKYPETAIADGKEGKVMVVATIGPDGRVINAEVQNGVREDLNQEALRLVRQMPAWHPAQMGGKPVATKAVVWVPFILNKNKETFK